MSDDGYTFAESENAWHCSDCSAIIWDGRQHCHHCDTKHCPVCALCEDKKPTARFVCPHCKNPEPWLEQYGSIGASWDGEIDQETGEWIDGGTEETCGDAIEVEGYHCRHCDMFFDEPLDLKPTA